MQRRCDEQLGVENFHSARIWSIPLVPPKVSFFCWTLLKGQTLTVDKLKSRRLQLVNHCVVCQYEEKNIMHLFIDCVLVKQIWHFIGYYFGIHNWQAMDLLGKLNTAIPSRHSEIG